MVRPAVVIKKERHIAGLLPGRQTGAEHRPARSFRVAAAGKRGEEFRRPGDPPGLLELLRHILRPDAGIRPGHPEEPERPGRRIGDGDADRGVLVSVVLLKMKIHDEPAGPGTEKHLGPFDDAAGTQQRVAGIPHVEGDPRVAPVVEIFRDIDMHADLGQIPGASRDFMFPVPVNPAAVPQQAAAVRVDMSSAVVRPEFAGVERVKHGHDEFPPVPLFFRLSDRVIITRNPCFSSAE